jgi:AAA domain
MSERLPDVRVIVRNNGETKRPPQPSQDGATPKGRHVTTTRASGIRSERVRWLWRERVPLLGPTVFAGEKGLGKSVATNAWLVARVTRGELDGELQGQPADVLVVTAEDSWSSVVKPRLMAHGADLDRVHRIEVAGDDGDATFTLPNDVDTLRAEIVRLREEEGADVRLVVMDPIGAFLAESTDSHNDAHVRRALTPIARLADELEIAVVIVAHLTKDESRRMLHRISGAGAFVNAARSVLAFARDPNDADGERGSDRVLVHVAANWGRQGTLARDPDRGARGRCRRRLDRHRRVLRRARRDRGRRGGSSAHPGR